MSKIRILSEKVATQIAAGEVIERPFSVLRELMDNSIDAESTNIFVKISKGGKSRIRVSDNGHGMDRDDLLLCVERHATSKIHEITDLFSVETLGFRGEALPSIASVSKLEIISRTSGSLVANKLTVNGGKLGAIEEVGAPQGTTVEVRDLFFNVPARRKFLRTVKTETDRIIDVFTRRSLSFPNIHFRLEADGKVLLNLPQTKDLVQRLSLVLGKDVGKAMIPVEEERAGISIRGFLAPSELGRSRGDRLYVYVNGRNVRDPLITKAIMEGYGQRLMKGIFPQAIIFLSLDPSVVDVNVHPTKQEVRFRNSHEIFNAIAGVINDALSVSRPVFSIPLCEDNRGEVSEPEFRDWAEGQIEASLETPDVFDQPQRQETFFEEPIQIIGQLGKTYILCQVRDGLMIVDQHAAHERIVYENLKKGFASSRLDVQRLLIPKRIELSLREKRIVEERGHVLKDLGIELDHFGGNTFLLRAVPSLLMDADWDRLLSELIGALDLDVVKNEHIIDQIMTSMACHAAIRAGHTLGFEEMRQLLLQLEDMSTPTNCPHGRPILIRFTFEQLEKMFRRIV